MAILALNRLPAQPHLATDRQDVQEQVGPDNRKEDDPDRAHGKEGKVQDSRKALAYVSAAFYNLPARRLTVIFPDPGLRITRATEVLRRPTAMALCACMRVLNSLLYRD